MLFVWKTVLQWCPDYMYIFSMSVLVLFIEEKAFTVRLLIIQVLFMKEFSWSFLARCVSEWVGLFLDTVGMVHLCLDEFLCKHLSKSS